MTKEEREEIVDFVYTRMSEEFRKIEDCDDIMEDIEDTERRHAENLEKLNLSESVIRTKLNILIGILCAIGGAILPVCIKILFKV